MYTAFQQPSRCDTILIRANLTGLDVQPLDGFGRGFTDHFQLDAIRGEGHGDWATYQHQMTIAQNKKAPHLFGGAKLVHALGETHSPSALRKPGSTPNGITTK
jgi:hypothetical protein